ncbi:MAG: hypothetical protein M1840_002731 [Geoglossum simile]|nr:MAG: hypothetical protein M1840_002731 [Geoglossum simile]
MEDGTDGVEARKKNARGYMLDIGEGVENAQQFKGVEDTRGFGPKAAEYAGEGGRRLVRLGRAGEGARAGRGLDEGWTPSCHWCYAYLITTSELAQNASKILSRGGYCLTLGCDSETVRLLGKGMCYAHGVLYSVASECLGNSLQKPRRMGVGRMVRGVGESNNSDSSIQG